MRILTILTLSAALLGAPSAWAAPAPAEQLQQVHLQAGGFAELEALAADTSLSQAALGGLLQSPDWRVRMNAGVVSALRLDPEAARAVMSVVPELTRADLPRFMGDEFRQPAAAPVLMHRYFGEQSEGVRYAIAEMLPRTKGDWGPAVASSWQDEPSAFVRSVLVESIRHAEPEVALAVLPLAAKDSSAEVRAAAVRGIGWLDQGAELGDVLLAGLTDSSPEVRAFAARAVGWKDLSNGWEPLRKALSDSDADVRLRALRALERMDAQRAAGLGELQTLKTDSDAKVARAARMIAGS